MAASAVIAQALAESTRLWAQFQREMDQGSQDGIVSKFAQRFAKFASDFEEILTELTSYSEMVVSEVGQNLNPFATPMYLHIHAAIPRRSDGTEQIAIPNQSNNNTGDGFIMGKGRIHCLGLAGSFVPEGITMTMKQFKSDETMTRQVPGWQVPICLGGIVPFGAAYGGEFNSAYCWIAYTAPNSVPASHCSGLYPYFERFGYHPDTFYTRFDVECLPEGKFWSAACVWESEQSHGQIKWRD